MFPVFLTIGLLLIASAIISFSVYSNTGTGYQKKSYKSNINLWHTQNLNSVISDMYMGFKIVPYVSSKRNKDMFNFQLKNNTPSLP